MLPPVPKLPEKLVVKTELFGDGRNGYRLQIRKNKKFGITVVSTKEHHDAQWHHELVIDCLPDQTFSSYADMREALEMLE